MSDQSLSNNQNGLAKRKWFWEIPVELNQGSLQSSGQAGNKNHRVKTDESGGSSELKALENKEEGFVKFNNGRFFVEMSDGTELEGIRQKLFLDRYSLKDENGEPMEKYMEQAWARMARGISQVEKTPELRKVWEEKFYSLLRQVQM